jgi:hypothetical protein
MKKLLMLSVAAWVTAIGTARAEVQITLHDGLVTVVAKDATARQILTEWSRVGQAKIINVDRVAGGPLTMELKDFPEERALEILLRSTSGYLAAPRTTAAVANLSRFDRVIVMPTSVAPRNTTPAPMQVSGPAFQQPQFAQPQLPDDDGDQPAPAVPTPNPRGPVFNTFPQPQVVNPQQQQFQQQFQQQGQLPQQPTFQQVPQQTTPQQQAPQPSAFPTAPFGGVAVPGMVAPTPQQQQQPGVISAPGQTQQPVRRPGGQ